MRRPKLYLPDLQNGRYLRIQLLEHMRHAEAKQIHDTIVLYRDANNYFSITKKNTLPR